MRALLNTLWTIAIVLSAGFGFLVGAQTSGFVGAVIGLWIGVTVGMLLPLILFFAATLSLVYIPYLLLAPKPSNENVQPVAQPAAQSTPVPNTEGIGELTTP